MSWLTVIFLIIFMSFSLVNKAESDAAIDSGLLASAQGNQQNEDIRRLIGRPAPSPRPPAGPPAGTPGHLQSDDSIDVQSHPLSEPSPPQDSDKNSPNRDLRREIEENK